MNIIDACIDHNIKKVVALSTDKASRPVSLYGATKLASDKMFVASNAYSGEHKTQFSVVRYGNVMGSRGSVIPFFMQEKNKGMLPITDNRMTRFMITLEEGVGLVWKTFDDMHGGEIYVKKIPSMRVVDLATAIDSDAAQKVIGIRPGEKLHEEMIGEDDSAYTYEYNGYYKILPAINNWSSSKKLIKNGKQVEKGFSYTSDNNKDWMSIETLQEWIKTNKDKIGRI
jgi:FlaA1/EpsC-like NDP-sugar epimerase